ncbi:uncharacterized protein TNCV_2098121 [Trichonephila clavipes]|nr:uncharacterized protein TNCV_2098121 [Trichonephila clavipes]
MLRRELHLGKHEGRALDEQTRTALNSNLGDQNRTVLVAVFFGVAHELGLSPLLTTEGARWLECHLSVNTQSFPSFQRKRCGIDQRNCIAPEESL